MTPVGTTKRHEGTQETLDVYIPTRAGRLAASVHLPALIPAPVVICCHGLMSSKSSTKFVAVGEEFSRAGLGIVRFDFSGCGQSAAVLGKDLISSRLLDLEAVIAYVGNQSWAAGPAGLLGSSLGGFVALRAAVSSARLIGPVVCWATPFDLKRLRLATERLDLAGPAFVDAVGAGGLENLGDLPPLQRVLLIQGEDDESVPWTESVEIYRRLGEPKQLVLIRTGDHRFLDPQCRNLLFRLSLNWFLVHLGGSPLL